MQPYEFSIIDLLPYLFSFIVLAFISNSKKTLEKKVWLMFLYILLFTAFRYGIGYDYFSYKKTIVDYDEYQFERIEVLGSLLMRLSYSTHYQLFFIVTSVLTIVPLYYIVKKYAKKPDLTLFVYLLFPLFYLNYLSIARNAVAYSIGLCVFFMLTYSKSTFKYLFAIALIAVAYGFHRSALFLVLLIVVKYLPIKKSILFVLFCVSFILSNYLVDVLSSFSDYALIGFGLEYLENHERAEGQVMTYLLNFMCVTNFLSWERLTNKDTRNEPYLKFCCIGTCIWNIFLPLESTMALRLSSYFTLFYIFLIPEYVNLKFGGIFIRRSFILSLLLLLMAFTFYRNIDAKGNGKGHISFLPYQTVFFHTDYSNYVNE